MDFTQREYKVFLKVSFPYFYVKMNLCPYEKVIE